MVDRRQDEVARELIELLKGQGRVRQTAKGAEFQDDSGRWIPVSNSSSEISEQVVRTRRVRQKDEGKPLWAVLIYQCINVGTYWNGIFPRNRYEYWLWTNQSLTKVFQITPFLGVEGDFPGSFKTFNGSLTFGPSLSPFEIITSWMSLDDVGGVHLSFRWYENFGVREPLENNIQSELRTKETWKHLYWKKGKVKEVPQSNAWNRRVINSPLRFAGFSVTGSDLVISQTDLEQTGGLAIRVPIVPIETVPPPHPCVRYWQIEGDFLADGRTDSVGRVIPEYFNETEFNIADFRFDAIGNAVQIYERKKQIYRFGDLAHVDGVSPGPIDTQRWDEPFVFSFYKGPLLDLEDPTLESARACSLPGIVPNGKFKIPGFNPSRIGYREGIFTEGGFPTTIWRPKSFAVF